jgi:outer membrane protein assembly factor BamB
MKPTLKTWITLTLLSSLASLAAGNNNWPQWRGPDRTGLSSETGLLQSWPKGGPEKEWIFKDAGIGYAGLAMVDGTLYTLGARGESEMLMAVNLKDGTEKWSTKMGGLLNNAWGNGPRSTPTITDTSQGKMVYALGGQGDLVCANAANGKIVWQTKMSDFGGGIPNWGYTESPLVDGDLVLCTPGGDDGAIVALNKLTGKLVWQSKDFTDPAQYSSIIAADWNDKRQYIQLTQESLVGIDSKNGGVLWRVDWNGRTAVIPTPIFKDGYVYITSGYGVGCMLVKLGKNNSAEEVYRNKNMKNHHGGVVLVGDNLYGYSDGVGWLCQDFKTGEEVWSEKGELGKGAVAYADGKLYCLHEDTGDLVLLDASDKGWNEISRFQLDPQTEQRASRGKIWTHPVICDGKLYLRDQEIIICYDISAK